MNYYINTIRADQEKLLELGIKLGELKYQQYYYFESPLAEAWIYDEDIIDYLMLCRELWWEVDRILNPVYVTHTYTWRGN